MLKRNDVRFDGFSKNTLVALIQVHEKHIVEVSDRVRSFENANLFVRVWRAIQGKVA